MIVMARPTNLRHPIPCKPPQSRACNLPPTPLSNRCHTKPTAAAKYKAPAVLLLLFQSDGQLRRPELVAFRCTTISLSSPNLENLERRQRRATNNTAVSTEQKEGGEPVHSRPVQIQSKRRPQPCPLRRKRDRQTRVEACRTANTHTASYSLIFHMPFHQDFAVHDGHTIQESRNNREEAPTNPEQSSPAGVTAARICGGDLPSGRGRC